jgi:hypothetical protein
MFFRKTLTGKVKAVTQGAQGFRKVRKNRTNLSFLLRALRFVARLALLLSFRL